jgi:hypothetical protein
MSTSPKSVEEARGENQCRCGRPVVIVTHQAQRPGEDDVDSQGWGGVVRRCWGPTAGGNCVSWHRVPVSEARVG